MRIAQYTFLTKNGIAQYIHCVQDILTTPQAMVAASVALGMLHTFQ